MSYILLIVESPAKCGKIEKILGNEYKCIASYGHLQELTSLKCIDISNNFQPKFTQIDSKRQQINKISTLVKNSKEVILATDDDREGEGIAWHLCKLFNLSIENTKRIIFHEITDGAIKKAVKSPTRLNMNLVNSQQARQILDLLVGYKISPLLWENISRTKKGLSAGRCQTPALRLIYENQKEIDSSPGKKVYNTSAYFTSQNLLFALNHNFDDEDKVVDFLEESNDFSHIFKREKPKDSTRKAPQPFTTSGLQQTASNELSISPKETMSICQKLYEGGYITYMRTDSKVYSKEFIEKTNIYIKEKYGDEYISNNEKLAIQTEKEENQGKDNENLGEKKEKKEKKDKKEKKEKKDKKDKKEKKDKKDGVMAQEAHEAIRPTKITILAIPEDFSSREKRMYHLIWKNTLESCMSDALYKTIACKISAPDNLEYKYLTEQVVFPGWKIVGSYEKISETYSFVQTLANEKPIDFKKIISKVTMKDLKTHYTEAKLVQLLEQRGIGRPSTFSSLIEKIQERDYVKKEHIKGKTITCTDFELENDEITEIETKREFGNEKNKLVIQNTGNMVLEFLIKTFNSLFEYEYTKNMEDKLDQIAKGNMEYWELCNECLREIESNNYKGENRIRDEIVLDDHNTYMVGKYGPVIKYSKNGETKFKSVKKDIDLQKLRNKEYELEDIVEHNNINRRLGIYMNHDLVLKKGKYGLYIEWGENKKSLNDIKIKESDIQIEDVIQFIENNSQNNNSNFVRKLTDNLSIRNGKYGDYIFYKKQNMKTPKFFKLGEFKENYKTCDEDLLMDWIREKYKI